MDKEDSANVGIESINANVLPCLSTLPELNSALNELMDPADRFLQLVKGGCI